jgi:hypothetical protein
VSQVLNKKLSAYLRQGTGADPAEGADCWGQDRSRCPCSGCQGYRTLFALTRKVRHKSVHVFRDTVVTIYPKYK